MLTIFVVAILLFAVFLVVWGFMDGSGGNSPSTHACTNCHSTVKPKKVEPGHPAVAIILLLFFIVPGLIYMIWSTSSKYRICPKCGSRAIVPLDTPAGRSIAAEQSTAS